MTASTSHPPKNFLMLFGVKVDFYPILNLIKQIKIFNIMFDIPYLSYNNILLFTFRSIHFPS
jgi:hypothetical protein